MKAICSFILALAVSSAGAQIRPVESLPIAVNYSKTIHLVFPSAVKYNQAVTDFVAVDNPESVPNILRIKANRKSFSKQTTVSVATEGGFFYSFNVTYADSLEHTNYFLPDMSSIRPDTAFSICKIMVVGAASPEGSIELNRRLSELRAKRLFDHVCGYSPLPDTLKTSVFVGRDWRGLLRLVENDPGMPGKSETVELLQGIVSEVEASGNGENKINELKRLRYGIPYRYMYRNLFPDLRASCLYIWYESKRKSFPAMQVISHLHDTLYLPCKLSPFGGETGGFQSGEKHGPFYMAVKTNMLYDALLVPNIGVEFYVGKNWSLAGNWMYAWWKSDRHHNYWRLYGGDLEVRRWFGRKASEKPLAGHHIGLYGRIFTYDFETGGTGYMGGKPGGTLWDKMNYSVGLEYGYSLPVARRLNLDFVIGVGYWGGEYHKYAPIDGHYVWKETRRRHWFGLTEAEISLVWLLGRGNYNEKKGGRQ